MRGIYFEPARNRWRARVYESGRSIFCGYFASEAEAIAALTAAKEEAKKPKLAAQDPQKLDTGSPTQALLVLLAALSSGLDAEWPIA